MATIKEDLALVKDNLNITKQFIEAKEIDIGLKSLKNTIDLLTAIIDAIEEIKDTE